MYNATSAYAKTSRATVSPRELEAQLLLRSAAKLTAVRDTWDQGGYADLPAALEFNKRLWLVFTSAMMRPENPLSNELKSNIANLAIFIFGRHLELSLEPEKIKLGALININREIAAGLATPVIVAQPVPHAAGALAASA